MPFITSSFVHKNDVHSSDKFATIVANSSYLDSYTRLVVLIS